MGCGEARLSRSINNTVHSFDLGKLKIFSKLIFSTANGIKLILDKCMSNFFSFKGNASEKLKGCWLNHDKKSRFLLLYRSKFRETQVWCLWKCFYSIFVLSLCNHSSLLGTWGGSVWHEQGPPEERKRGRGCVLLVPDGDQHQGLSPGGRQDTQVSGYT